MQPSLIVGAGLTGLIAAHAWPQARVIDSMPEPVANHRALLRFRTDAVARLTGAEFKKVKVRKGIWSEGKFVQPNIRLANLYAQKVLPGAIVGDRSIWNLEPVDRYVAAESFYGQLVESIAPRIEWGVDFGQVPITARDKIVSTIPLSTLLSFPLMAVGAQVAMGDIEFKRSPIHVARFTVRGADLYQTVYFPDADTMTYRASMTGETLIVESMAKIVDHMEVCQAFGLNVSSLRMIESTEQRFGKIAPIDDRVRREILFRLTHDLNIYSLGRFATWRNILLDDVVSDIDVIKRLMRRGDSYELRRAS